MIQFDQMPAAPSNLLNGVVRPPAIPGPSYYVNQALMELQRNYLASQQVPAYAVPPTAAQHQQAVAQRSDQIPPAILEVQRNTMLIRSAQKIQQGR